ncbi:MAG: glycoside hydrolase family 99-like domain-containing protein [Arthrobacter sp.]
MSAVTVGNRWLEAFKSSESRAVTPAGRSVRVFSATVLFALAAWGAGAVASGATRDPLLISQAIVTLGISSVMLYRCVVSQTFNIAWSIFWTWTFVFMALAPAFQLAATRFPWKGTFAVAAVATGQQVILAGLAAAAIGYFITRRLPWRPERALLGVTARRWQPGVAGVMAALLWAQLATGILFAALMGPSLFNGRVAFRETLLRVADLPGGGSLYFLAEAGAIAIPAAGVALFRSGIKVSGKLLMAAIVVGAVVTNPLIGSRFLTGSFVVALVAAYLINSKWLRWLPASTVFVFVTVFPTLDLMRGDGTGSSSVGASMPSATLLNFDFDAFEMLLRGVSVEAIPDGMSNRLDLFIAPFLRWIPALSNLVQGHASGPVVANVTGMSYTNVSMPLWGEAHLVGGLLGVFGVFLLLGALLAWAGPRFPGTAAGLSGRAIAAPVAALLFMVLRGSLYEVLGFLLLAVAVGAVIAAAVRAGAVTPQVSGKETDKDSLVAEPNRPLTVAFYLPQYHAIPENDEWWGKGFTEWTNVRKASALFDGHDHPRRPADLGYYDLTTAGVSSQQAALAQANGVDAFCFYYYWFAGKRLLERPVDDYLERGPDFPFCISWANENWTRRWDGQDQAVLIGQDYGDGTAEQVFLDFLPYLRDPRYLRVDGRAVIVVHRVDHLPDAPQFARTWRALAAEYGVGPLQLIAAETKPGIRPDTFGFDAVCEFPPVGSNTLAAAKLLPPAGMNPSFRGRVMSYPRMVARFMRRPEPGFVRYRGVAPGWDNTARRSHSSTVYMDSSPEGYRRWLQFARASEGRRPHGMVFINAWNEWAEGSYLEPDETHGMDYLRATRWEAEPLPRRQRAAIGAPGLPWLQSLAKSAAGSVLAHLRVLRNNLARLRRG